MPVAFLSSQLSKCQNQRNIVNNCTQEMIGMHDVQVSYLPILWITRIDEIISSYDPELV